MQRLALECILLAVALTDGTQAILAQALGAAGNPQQRVRSYLQPFGQGQQRLLTGEAPGVKVSLLRTECETCPAGPTFVLDVSDERRGTEQQFKLSNGAGQLDEIRIAPNAIAILIGRVDANTSYITLMDLGSGGVRKEFYAFAPCVSDDNRLIAFVKPYPLHFTPGVSNEYMVYDVEALWPGGADEKPAGLAASMNAGHPIYPEAATSRYGDNILANLGEVHSWGSEGFYWLGGEHILAFADHWHSSVSLVLADLRGGIPHPLVTVQPLDNEKVANVETCAQYADHLGSTFGVDAVNLVSTDPLTASFALRQKYPDCPLSVTEIRVHSTKM